MSLIIVISDSPSSEGNNGLTGNMDERVTYSGKLKENSNQKKQYFDI
jgi:hypothetical protein